MDEKQKLKKDDKGPVWTKARQRTEREARKAKRKATKAAGAKGTG